MNSGAKKVEIIFWSTHRMESLSFLVADPCEDLTPCVHSGLGRACRLGGWAWTAASYDPILHTVVFIKLSHIRTSPSSISVNLFLNASMKHKTFSPYSMSYGKSQQPKSLKHLLL